jgi:hypothetical protein
MAFPGAEMQHKGNASRKFRRVLGVICVLVLSLLVTFIGLRYLAWSVNEGLKVDEETADNHFRNGVSALDHRDFHLAIAQFSAALQLYYKVSDAYWDRGMRALTLPGRSPTLDEFPTNAGRLSEKIAKSRTMRGIAYDGVALFSEALTDFSAAEKSSSDPELFEGRAHAYRALGQTKKADLDDRYARDLRNRLSKQ